MNLNKLVTAWRRFFFEPQSPIPLGLFRILYGTCVFCTLLLLRPEWSDWYGPHAWISQRSMFIIAPDPRLSLFSIVPQTDVWISALFWIFLAASIFLTFGFCTRISTIVVYLCMASLHQRNPFIMMGGDDFLRIAGFFLIFAPAGAVFSCDRLLRIRWGRESATLRQINPWAQRMIQLELAFVYFMAFWQKMRGAEWRNGTAVYYVLHYHALARFPFPHWALGLTAASLLTWSVLLFQLCFPFLVWIRRLRYPMLLLGLGFHLGLLYGLDIPMFQWDILSAYVLFLDPELIRRALNLRIRRSSLAESSC